MRRGCERFDFGFWICDFGFAIAIDGSSLKQELGDTSLAEGANMLRKMSAVVVLAGLVLGVAGGCGMFGNKEKEERMSMTALPEPVRTAFNRDFPNANVSSVVHETEKDGAIHYELKFTDQSGRKQEVEYDRS